MTPRYRKIGRVMRQEQQRACEKASAPGGTGCCTKPVRGGVVNGTRWPRRLSIDWTVVAQIPCGVCPGAKRRSVA